LTALLAAASLVVALGLGACSRSATDSLTGPAKSGGAVAFDHGGLGNPPPPAPPPAANPCTAIGGLGGAVVGTGAVAQNRLTRLRVEVTGDVAAGTLNKIATCSTSAAPTVSFISGTASLNGTSFAVGALTVPPGEAGALLATDAAGNTLEIIFPGLAVPAVPGPPIIRVQTTRGVATGSSVSVRASLVARTANGQTATFTVSASNLVAPALR
ncbi:MAG TPA: hypothetical protein VKQ32_29365, partial [Polyangia bacterium]|nr:hypothetical protein [Polyangia bacterium]